MAEVHPEVGEVLEHEHVILVGELADDLEFFLGEADPGGVVGVGVDDGVDVTLLEVAFEFGTEFLAAVLIHVEGLVLEAEHAVLLFLDGEAGVDEQGGVAFLAGAHEGHKGGHTGHHRAHGGDAVFRVHVQIDEVLDEAGGLFLEVGDAFDVRVQGGDSLLEGLDLGFHAHVAGGEAGDAHFHSDELLAGRLFNVIDEAFHFTDGGFSDFLDAAVGDNLVNDFDGDGGAFHKGYCIFEVK